MDLSAYQTIYMEEARKNLAELQRQLARVEDGTIEPEGVETAQRAAHSLKGDSATMGYDELAALAYAIEVPLKKAAQQGDPLPADFASTLRATLDRLEEALEAMN
jgi:two-component system chemotaxis sensor kinase CheA